MKDNNLISSFLDYIEVEKGRGKNTTASYAVDIRQFTRFINKNLTLVSTKDIRMWIGELRRQQRCAITTIIRKLIALRQLYNFFLKEEIIEKNPVVFIELPKREHRLPTFLTFEEMQKVISYAQSNTYSVEGKRDYCLLMLLYYTGIRVSELIALKFSDIVFTEKDIGIRVLGKGNKERIIPLNKRAYDALSVWQMNRPSTTHDFVFISKNKKPINRIFVFRKIRSFVRKAGINKNISPHKIRHTFATHLLAKGGNLVDIQALLGHASLSTTQIYTHTDIGRLTTVVEKL